MTVKNISTISERTVSFRPPEYDRRVLQAFPIKTVKAISTTRESLPDYSNEVWYKKSFREFCNATALHGYNYIVRPGASLTERLVWIVIVTVATVTAIVLLYVSWAWNAQMPTTTVIENTHYATWNIPFPAVTICNINKISSVAALQQADQMFRPANMTAAELSAMFRLVLHFEGIGSATIDEYERLNTILRQNNLSVEGLLRRIAPRCSDMLERCMWKGTQTRCDNLFQEVNSTEGVCCSFNNHALAVMNYPSKLVHSFPRQPRKVTACGYQTGLTVLAKPFVSDYHSTFLSSTGFRVFVHNSYDYADDNAETKYVTSLSEAFITITPESTYSTPGIWDMPLSDRDCLFGIERPLHVMQRYTYTNCMTECRSNLLLSECECVPYNYPNNGSVPVCQMNHMECVQRYKSVFNAALPGTNFSAATLADTDCDCLPDCELLQYGSEITTGRLNREYSFNSMTFFKDIVLEDQSLIHVYFNDLVSTLYRKDGRNWLGTLASFGGLLGLLLGFSFVTGFECVYFFTLQPLFDHLKKKRNEAAVHPMQ